MSELVVAEYHASDQAACLSIFDDLCPKFFSPSERAEFVDFLEDPGEYLVVRSGTVVACGGIGFKEGDAVLTWGMVRPNSHGCGIGRLLTEERLRRAATANARRVVMSTSQLTVGLYERVGFRRTSQTVDGYGTGLDRIDLVLEL